MKRWALASVLVLSVTVALIAIIMVSPDWPSDCSNHGDDADCGSVVSPLLVGLIGALVSVGLLFVGFLRRDP